MVSMSSNIINQVAFLRTSRNFPEELHQLTVEVNKAYVDIANCVNSRTISLFPTGNSAITGESYFIKNNQKQQSLRQFYPVTSTAPIAHNIKFSQIDRFTKTYGEFTDNVNWYALIPGSNVAISGQISFYLTPTNIIFIVGAGAPALTKGNIVLEWLSNP